MFRGRWASPLDEHAVLASPPAPRISMLPRRPGLRVAKLFPVRTPPLATLGCLNIEIGGAGAALGKLTSHKKTFAQVAKLFPSITLERCAMTCGCGTRIPCWLLVGLRWVEGYLVLGGEGCTLCQFLVPCGWGVPCASSTGPEPLHVPRSLCPPWCQAMRLTKAQARGKCPNVFAILSRDSQEQPGSH